MMDIFTDSQNSLLLGLTDSLSIRTQDLTKDANFIRSTFMGKITKDKHF
jgi:hypothetical protein